MGEKRLTFLEAAATVMGAGVGSGIMAVPYLAQRCGLVPFLVILAAAFGINVLVHLMLVEVALRDGEDLQIVELIRKYALAGRVGLVLVWAFFAVLLLAFVANLSAYLSGAGDVVAGLTGLGVVPSKLATYAACALVVLAGLKAVGLFEKLALWGMGATVLIVAMGMLGRPFHIEAPAAGGFGDVLGLYAVTMYCFFAFFAVPQVVKGLGRDGKRSGRAVAAGLAVNGVLTLFFALAALGVSRPVTEVAVVGISSALGGSALGGVAAAACSVFVILAMVSSYWSVSLALADMLRERTGLARIPSWAVATLPSLLLVAVPGLGFIDYLSLAGGITVLIVLFVTLPMYLNARKRGPVREPGLDLGRFLPPPVLVALFVLCLLAAAGAFLSA